VLTADGRITPQTPPGTGDLRRMSLINPGRNDPEDWGTTILDPPKYAKLLPKMFNFEAWVTHWYDLKISSVITACCDIYISFLALLLNDLTATLFLTHRISFDYNFFTIKIHCNGRRDY
jgi:hypothetical protein